MNPTITYALTANASNAHAKLILILLAHHAAAGVDEVPAAHLAAQSNLPVVAVRKAIRHLVTHKLVGTSRDDSPQTRVFFPVGGVVTVL